MATSLGEPVDLQTPGDPSRLFVVERGGRIRLLRNGTLVPTPFLDIRDRGVQPFLWNEDDEALDEHISRLEWLLLDLLHVSDAEPERFERKKAAIEAALYKVYRDGLDRAPPLVKKKVSMSPGAISASLAPSRARGSVAMKGLA